MVVERVRVHRHPFDISAISQRIWQEKYQLRAVDGTAIDATIEDSWQRVAQAAAAAERGRKTVKARYAQAFYNAMADFIFLPAGRILAGAGSNRDVTLFNCFVMGAIEDDLGSIFEQLREAALTMQKGGGIGHDFSTLRPNGALVRSIGADASGPVSFMHVWDAMCQTIMSAGARRGAMMGTLRCDHPDIEMFIDAKADPASLRNFNVSVLVPDAFIEAVRADADWDLVFGGEVHRTVRARALWQRLMRATYDYAEPGVIFIDRINALNNLNYCETIGATNPCGEQPLPPYGACLLGSINLARLVSRPFAEDAELDTVMLEDHVRIAVRFLDNIIDVSKYPLAAQKQEARAKRRIGLGVTGLADALIFCGLDYDSEAARKRAGQWMAAIQNAAYLASAELAADRGAFPLYEPDAFMRSANVDRLNTDVKAAIATHGMRNGCLTSVAPTGTISLVAGNVSSGVEPLFATEYQRRVLEPDGSSRQEPVTDYAVALYRALHPGAALPDTCVTTADLSADAHLKMQSAVQPHVDSSISKTINCPADMSFDDFQDIYLKAHEHGLKGCTTFRPNAVTGVVLTGLEKAAQAVFDAAEAPFEVPGQGAGEESCQASDQDSGQDTTAVPFIEPEQRDAAMSDVIFMTEPLERDEVLTGQTYKLKWPGSAHAIYVTINDIGQEGRRRPFEIFINTKNLEHQAWTVALTRMISAVFRRGGDVTFVVEELKAIFDPQGGQWMDGRYVPSLIAAIGDIIERHMVQTGCLHTAAEPTRLAPPLTASAGAPADGNQRRLAGSPPGVSPGSSPASPSASTRHCPRCGDAGLQRREGCWSCPTCGYSHCG